MQLALNEGADMPTLISKPWFADRPVMDRTRHIARVLAGHGLGAFLHHTGFEKFAPKSWSKADGHALSQPERLRMALGELGATFTKLGQMMSTRGDMLPPEYLVELAKLQDQAPLVPEDQILALIEHELDSPASEVFGSFELRPLASASIGQVHAATLLDGSRVVVKVQRPGVADQIERDLRILARITDWIERSTEYGVDYDVWSLHSEFAHTIRGELDYIREGRNVDRMRRAFAGDPGIRIPIVYWPHTTHRVLTMERMEGIKITDLAALDAAGLSRREIAETAVRTFLRQILEFGYFHADPHPGNFFVEPDGTIALVDFGSARRDADPVAKTLVGVVIGTPYYLSPEQALGGGADERSDLYSVGVMLYELLTGTRMYAAGSLVALFEMHKNAPIPKLPDAVSRHQRFLERLVAKKPDERYRNAAQALEALMDYATSEAKNPAIA
jgi:ubiquinone biosynthesis protein